MASKVKKQVVKPDSEGYAIIPTTFTDDIEGATELGVPGSREFLMNQRFRTALNHLVYNTDDKRLRNPTLILKASQLLHTTISSMDLDKIIRLERKFDKNGKQILSDDGIVYEDIN